MISKNRMKEISLLAMKKHRDSQQKFIAEGPKIVTELLPIFPCHYLAGLPSWLRGASPELLKRASVVEETNEAELKKASFLQTPQEVIAIFEKPQNEPFHPTLAKKGLCLALDGVQDPGNLGTILRLADWFGIEHIICSQDCADAFQPKVVQASMGAIGRVHIHRTELETQLKECHEQEIPIYGTFLDGENIHQKTLSQNGIIIMGNEGKGIRKETAQWVNEKLFIPSFPPERPTSESLNVAIATAIVCAEFRRKWNG